MSKSVHVGTAVLASAHANASRADAAMAAERDASKGASSRAACAAVAA